MIIRRFSIAVSLMICIGLTISCQSGGTPTSVPTEAFIPVTPTATPSPTLTPVPPTVTPPPPTAIDVPPTATTAPIEAIIEFSDAIDVALVARVIAHHAQQRDADPQQVRLVRAQSWRWQGDSLACRDDPTVAERVTGYRLELLLGARTAVYHTDGTHILLCPGGGRLRDELLLRVDPIAAELGALARRRVAEARGVNLYEVRLVEAIPIAWPDTSLGCPQEGQTYAANRIDGYRFVVGVDDDLFAFHTDARRLLPCPAGDAVLPDDV